MNRIETSLRVADAAMAFAMLSIRGTPTPTPDLTHPLSNLAEVKAQSTSLLEPPAFERLTPTALPTIGPDLLPTSAQLSLPFEVRIITTSPRFQRWRRSLQEGTEVTITDFGESGYQSRVIPNDGVKLRTLPDTHSKPAQFVPWLRWGQEIPVRFLISILGSDKRLLESWIIIGKETQKKARWECEDGWPRAHGHCFAAAQIGKEMLIDIKNVPLNENGKSYEWPTP